MLYHADDMVPGGVVESNQVAYRSRTHVVRECPEGVRRQPLGRSLAARRVRAKDVSIDIPLPLARCAVKQVAVNPWEVRGIIQVRVSRFDLNIDIGAVRGHRLDHSLGQQYGTFRNKG